MRKPLTALVVGSIALLGIAGTAQAAPWQSINQRQANLEQRIDAGVRDGSLTRREADRLRGEFFRIERLEHTYRRNGLSWRERQDLDRRFNALSGQIRVQRHDDQTRRDHRRWH